MKCEFLQCTNEVESVVGKQQRRFCSDKCRKASKRAEVRESKALTSPVVDELRTDGTKLSTSVSPTTDKTVTPVIKRGKNIKVFADLPPDVQATIDRISESDEEHSRRTAIAISYQHVFPGRYECHSLGVVPEANPVPVRVSKPGDADYKPLCQFTRDWTANHV